MTDHQPMPVAGYTSQSNDIMQLDLLKARDDIDQRWLAIGRTHIEEAFMAINRALLKPQRLP